MVEKIDAHLMALCLATLILAVALSARRFLRDRKSRRTLDSCTCPLCRKGYLHPLRSQFMKKCGSCGHEVRWDLKDGQKPLVSSHRDKRK